MEILSSFIVFEGLDGAGTTTQIRNLAKYYEVNGRRYHITNEPTSSPIGTLIRQILQKKVMTTPDALAYLYAADRSDHLYNPDHGITRLLSDGSIVMSDRYFYSSIAYQSVECDRDLIERINRFPSPEFLIFIDTPVDECMARIEKRGGEKELFDRAGFLRLVRENYMRQLDALPEGVHLLVVDGTAGIDDVERSVRSFLAPFSL